MHRIAAGTGRKASIVSSFAKKTLVPVRHLNIHEYQSKFIMEKYGVHTQRYRVVSNPDQALTAAKELNVREYVIKAQVHAGGRGKGYFKENQFQGGVHLCNTADKAAELTKTMLGNCLITKQTPPEGVKVQKVMVAESLDIRTEKYFAILMDRASQGPVMVASSAGGMDIETVAHDTPHLIFKEPIKICEGVRPEQTKRLAEAIGFQGDALIEAQEQMNRLYELFLATDATQVEINPFAECAGADHKVYCVDAKMNFDDNAAFRQKEIFGFRDIAEEDPREVAASQYDLNFVGMDGSIGCMVNGAGLAMATMDIIKLYNGEPANFLDVGGGANEKQVEAAFRILDADPKVRAILVNIFGGIMKCDTIATGIVNAMRNMDMRVPLVVRLEGTNVEKGQAILRQSGFKIIAATDLDDAAIKAVATLSQ